MKVDKKIKSQRSNWKFDKNVAENFDIHVLTRYWRASFRNNRYTS